MCGSAGRLVDHRRWTLETGTFPPAVGSCAVQCSGEIQATAKRGRNPPTESLRTPPDRTVIYKTTNDENS